MYGLWWVALVVGALGLFVAWCGADFLQVRYDFRTSDALLGAALLLLLFWNAWFSRPHPAWFLRAVALTVASAVIALALVLFFGIRFHFAIGGSL